MKLTAAALACLFVAGTVLAQIPEDKEPMITTPSGLKISILKAGTDGPKIKPFDKAKVHYTGWLPDGKKFDSSRDRGQPFEVTVGMGVIDGWSEGLTHATPGTSMKLTIPPAIAYGERGMPPTIPPNATLIFEIEVLEVSEGPQAPAFRKLDPEKAKTTESGLRYEIENEGTLEGSKPDDKLVVHYVLWTDAGKILDWSRVSRRPFHGPPWQAGLPFVPEAMALMKPGAVIRCEVPSKLGFGEQGRGPIPANATTYWHFEAPLPMKNPEFSLTPEDKLRKTPTGLGFEVLKEGEGKMPAMGEQVTVHYIGWLKDGKVFDSSYARGEPMTFRLGEVIKGWNEGLQLMKEGAIYKLTIPAGLAYGEQGRPGIPPNADLIFQVELIKVTK